MEIILHITRRDQWDRAKAVGLYDTPSLYSQGFIHCSKPDQVIAVANFLFHGQTDLVLLCISTERVEAEIRYENLEGGDQRFPHIYGPLNLNAVTKALDFEPRSDGTFVLPEELVPDGS